MLNFLITLRIFWEIKDVLFIDYWYYWGYVKTGLVWIKWGCTPILIVGDYLLNMSAYDHIILCQCLWFAKKLYFKE